MKKKAFKLTILLCTVFGMMASQSFAQQTTSYNSFDGRIPIANLLRSIDPDRMHNPLVKSKAGQVSIYADHDNGLFGRSLYRTLVLTVRDPLYKRTDTYYVSKEIGSYLTAVLLSADTVTVLQETLQSGQSVFLGEYEIEIDRSVQSPMTESPVYRFRNNAQQLDMSFSVERAPEELIKLIQQFYADDPKNRQLVEDAYRSGYIIRIFAAENFIDPWNHDISMNEALVMATYIGDLEQPFWGIADGNAHLARALTKMK